MLFAAAVGCCVTASMRKIRLPAESATKRFPLPSSASPSGHEFCAPLAAVPVRARPAAGTHDEDVPEDATSVVMPCVAASNRSTVPGFRRRDINAAAIGRHRNIRSLRHLRQHLKLSRRGRSCIMQLDHGIRAMICNIKVAGAIQRQPHRLDKLHTLRRPPLSRDAGNDARVFSSTGVPACATRAATRLASPQCLTGTHWRSVILIHQLKHPAKPAESSHSPYPQ